MYCKRTVASQFGVKLNTDGMQKVTCKKEKNNGKKKTSEKKKGREEKRLKEGKEGKEKSTS